MNRLNRTTSPCVRTKLILTATSGALAVTGLSACAASGGAPADTRPAAAGADSTAAVTSAPATPTATATPQAPSALTTGIPTTVSQVRPSASKPAVKPSKPAGQSAQCKTTDTAFLTGIKSVSRGQDTIEVTVHVPNLPAPCPISIALYAIPHSGSAQEVGGLHSQISATTTYTVTANVSAVSCFAYMTGTVDVGPVSATVKIEGLFAPILGSTRC